MHHLNSFIVCVILRSPCLWGGGGGQEVRMRRRRKRKSDVASWSGVTLCWDDYCAIRAACLQTPEQNWCSSQVSIFEVNPHVAPQQVMFRLIAIQHPAELQDLSLRAVVATSATGKQQQLKKQKQKQNRTKKWIPSHKQCWLHYVCEITSPSAQHLKEGVESQSP